MCKCNNYYRKVIVEFIALKESYIIEQSTFFISTAQIDDQFLSENFLFRQRVIKNVPFRWLILFFRHLLASSVL